MTFNSFTNFILTETKCIYGENNVKVEQINKLNNSYLGLKIQKDNCKIVPVINLYDLYLSYYDDHTDILKTIISLVENCDYELETPLTLLTEYHAVKDRLFIQVSSASSNEIVLSNIPHTIVEDLAISYHVLVNSENGSIASITITNGIMKHYSISKDTLHTDAIENSQNVLKPVVATLSDCIISFGSAFTEDIDSVVNKAMSGHVPAIILSNNRYINGAAAMFYPNILKTISEKFGFNIFILPSSTHECLLIPDAGDIDINSLIDMVVSVNETTVLPIDKLSDNVYYYNLESNSIRSCKPSIR